MEQLRIVVRGPVLSLGKREALSPSDLGAPPSCTAFPAWRKERPSCQDIQESGGDPDIPEQGARGCGQEQL